jgi:DNA-binding transcriptional LysR family regulator
MDELGDLRLFVRIAAAGSLSETARRLNMSLPAVSRRLSALEDRLRVRLIDRAPRKFELTDEGQVLYAHAQRIVEELDTTLAELDGAAATVGGHLRIAAPSEIGRRHIAPLCREFTAMNPLVTIDLRLSDVRPDVLEDELDVAIVTKRPTDGDVISRKLLEGRRVVCAAPLYLEQAGTPQTPEALADHNCIRLRRGRLVHDTWKLRGPAGPHEYPVAGNLLSDSTDVIHRWALEGAGIAMKAHWDVHDELNAGALVEVLPDYACDDIGLYATHLTRRHVPKRVRLIIDLLAERLPRLSAGATAI